jgi:hypothetical protein
VDVGEVCDVDDVLDNVTGPGADAGTVELPVAPFCRPPFLDLRQVVFGLAAFRVVPQGDKAVLFLYRPSLERVDRIVRNLFRIGDIDTAAVRVEYPAVKRAGDGIAADAAFTAGEIGTQVGAVCVERIATRPDSPR